MVVGIVHGCFKRLERAADWLTGAAGPYFVGVGFTLLMIGGASFFIVMLPIRVPAPAPLASLFDTHSPFHVLLGIVPTFLDCFTRTYALDTLAWLGAYGSCSYILFMIAWAYLMACLEAPGNPVIGLSDNLHERRLGPGSGVWWARFRERAALASGPPLRRPPLQPRLASSGSVSTTSAVPVTPASAIPPSFTELDYEPASPIRPNLHQNSTDSSRRGSGDLAARAHSGSEGSTRRNSFARVTSSLSTLLKPITGSSRAVYQDEHDGSAHDGLRVTGTGTGILPRAPTPGAMISGRKSAQGNRENGGADHAQSSRKESQSGSMQIPMLQLPSKPGRTPDLEASNMTEPFAPAPLRPSPLTMTPTFTHRFSAEPQSASPSLAAPTPVLVRPTPRYPDTTGDAFDLELDSEDLFPLPAKMCMKCKPVPLYVAIASLPPEMRKVEKLLRMGAREEELERLRRGEGPSSPSLSGSAGGGAAGLGGGGGGGGGRKGRKKGKNGRNRGGRGSESDRRGPNASLNGASRQHSGPSAPNTPLTGGAADFLPAFALQDDDAVDDEDEDEGEAEVRAWLGEEEAMKLVPPPKPERTHHCSVCKTCVMKYDHHCPWINACVGLGNERYFVLFLFWLSVGCATVVGTGYPLLPHVVRGWKASFLATKRTNGARYRPFSADNDDPVLRQYTGLDFAPPIDDRLGDLHEPDLVARSFVGEFSNFNFSIWTRVFVLLSLLICALMGFAVFIMLIWQLIMVGKGESTVESHDNGYYRKLAKRRGQRFMNVYDVGFIRNLLLFFSLGPGSSHSFVTIFLPLRIPPYSDGWHWAKRRGLGGRHGGIVPVEELTDDEGDDDAAAVPVPPLRPQTRGPGEAGRAKPSPVMTSINDTLLKAIDSPELRE